MEIAIGIIIGVVAGLVLYLVGRREIAPLRAETSGLRAELDELRQQLQAGEVAKTTVETQLAARDEQIQKHEVDLATTRSRLEQSATEVNRLGSELADAKAIAEQRRERVDELVAERDQAVRQRDHNAEELSVTRQELEGLRKEHQARMEELAKKQEEIDSLFKSIAADVAKASNEEFRKQAAEDFKRQRELAEQELKQRVEPVGQGLADLKKQIDELEKRREGAYEGVSELIKATQQQVGRLTTETGDLREILRSSRHRGQWGEQTLENILELAGLRRGTDFTTQTSGEHGTSIADFVVRVPGGRRIIIDAKTPFDTYRAALDADTVDEQAKLLRQHAETVRSTASALAKRRYDQQFEGSLDFVVMWIPTDSILEGATRAIPSLIEDAFSKDRVLLATPVTMIALVSGLAAALRQEEQVELLHANALQIQAAGTLLYSGVRNHAADYLKLGRDLNRVFRTYDAGVASIQGNLIRGARDMRELGAGEGDDIADPETLNLETRQFRSVELQDLNQKAD